MRRQTKDHTKRQIKKPLPELEDLINEQSTAIITTLYEICKHRAEEVVLTEYETMKKRFADFEASMKSWSEQNGMTLSTSYGYVRCSEFPDSRVTELVKTADDRMYEAKAQYYLTNGKDRRRFISVVASEELNSPVPGGL